MAVKDGGRCHLGLRETGAENSEANNRNQNASSSFWFFSERCAFAADAAAGVIRITYCIPTAHSLSLREGSDFDSLRASQESQKCPSARGTEALKESRTLRTERL